MTEKSEHIIRQEHFVAGVETERERIISLLEAEIDPKVWDAQMMTIAWCVALIKEESND